jgi:putative Mg2+ transporter-C (MgtC) family protein
MDATPALATHIGHADILARLGLAALIGAVLGLDRELKSCPLGLRTNMLVAVGAALFGIITEELVVRFTAGPPAMLRFDPTNVIAGIITGIGFLGAGAIIQGRRDVQGGTTAAAVWVLGGVGLACGLGLYALAAIAGLGLACIVTVLGFITTGRARGRREGTGAEPALRR